MRDWFAAFRVPLPASAQVTRVTRVTGAATLSIEEGSVDPDSVTPLPDVRVTRVTASAPEASVTHVTPVATDGVTSAERPKPPSNQGVSSPVASVTYVTRFSSEIPPEWVAGIERLNSDRPPAGVAPARWCQAVLDAVGLLQQWGTQAARCGWTAVDFFGLHPTRPESRFDCAGLAWLLDGATLQKLDERLAVIIRPSGSQQTWRRLIRADLAVPMWELPAGDEGEH